MAFNRVIPMLLPILLLLCHGLPPRVDALGPKIYHRPADNNTIVPAGWTVPRFNGKLSNPDVVLLADLELSTYQPITGSVSLPPVPSNMSLTFIAVERGIWNFSCKGINATTRPLSVGGLSTIYDAAPLVKGMRAENNFHLWTWGLAYIPSNETESFINLKPVGIQYYPSLFHPVYDLRSVGIYVDAGYEPGSIWPPAISPGGPSPNGQAIFWVTVGADPKLSYGAQWIYRVYVAGGEGLQQCGLYPVNYTFSMEYSSELWFFN